MLRAEVVAAVEASEGHVNFSVAVVAVQGCFHVVMEFS